MSYRVCEMVKILGVASSTLRYYDKEGLLMRIFQERNYKWFKVIACLKHTGMSMKILGIISLLQCGVI